MVNHIVDGCHRRIGKVSSPLLENETRRLIGWLPGGPGGHVAGLGAPSGGPWESEGALAPTAKQNKGSPSDPVEREF